METPANYMDYRIMRTCFDMLRTIALFHIVPLGYIPQPHELGRLNTEAIEIASFHTWSRRVS